MTKERKIAIKLWEDIKERIRTNSLPGNEYDAFFYRKQMLAKDVYNVDWENSCWFCQYMRRSTDQYRDINEEVNPGKGLGEEGCNLCPLAKAHPLYNPSDCGYDCGCDLPGAPWRIVGNTFKSDEERMDACDVIIQALKGEPVVIEAPEEAV